MLESVGVQRANRPLRRRRPFITGCFLAALAILGLGACMHFPNTVDSDIDTDGGDLNELLDLHTNSHQDAGSTMEILTDGPDSYAAFRELIESAEHHLHVETLNFDDDRNQNRDYAIEFANLFAEKACQGVAVRLIIDPIAQSWWSNPDIEAVLYNSDIEIIDYMLPDLRFFPQLLFRTHKKILIADGERAIVGGMNYGYLYFEEGEWRDTNVLLGGPVVATIQQEFLRDWRMLGGTVADEDGFFPPLAATGPFSIRVIDQRPGEGDFDLNNAILIAIRSAESHIDIEAAYFNPSDWLLNELGAAVDRGVEVRVLANSGQSIDIFGVYAAMSTQYRSILGSGIRIFLWELPHTMHSKAMVVDDKLAMIGSHNFNARSIAWDTENAVFFSDPAAIEAVQQMIDADLLVEGVVELKRY